MGENAFIAFGLAAFGLAWQQRLGTVFVSGAIFLLLTLTGLRVWLANAIPQSLKHSFAAGIGLFLLLIGFATAELVTVNIPAAPLRITPWGMPQLFTIAGVIVIAWLMHRKFPAPSSSASLSSPSPACSPATPSRRRPFSTRRGTTISARSPASSTSPVC
jgi:AGZA family xanthine/uracil permease-like MFS transporter